MNDERTFHDVQSEEDALEYLHQMMSPSFLMTEFSDLVIMNDKTRFDQSYAFGLREVALDCRGRREASRAVRVPLQLPVPRDLPSDVPRYYFVEIRRHSVAVCESMGTTDEQLLNIQGMFVHFLMDIIVTLGRHSGR